MKAGFMGQQLPPTFLTPIEFPSDWAPRLFVIVDTEEEFDWSGGFSRENVDVSAISEVGRLQGLLGRYQMRPTYVIDYPVATTPSSAERLSELAARGECHIGAHLHPWVNPPFTASLGSAVSYGCNLGLDLELDKILRLREAIGEHLGTTPRVYKAGRYGFGATTAEALEWLDFDVDASVNPRMDFSTDGGPSFEAFDARPSFFGRRRHLLELPCTTGFVGAARRLGSTLHRAVSARWLEPFHAVGLLARTGTLNKVMLSPEGNSFEEMRSLTETLYRDGVRTFSMTLHSPSLKAGGTQYVRTGAELKRFLDTIDRYCEYFFTRLGGVPSTPADLYDELQTSSPERRLGKDPSKCVEG
jgi:hypothetical protein